MRKEYIAPEIEIIAVEEEVITSSGDLLIETPIDGESPFID